MQVSHSLEEVARNGRVWQAQREAQPLHRMSSQVRNLEKKFIYNNKNNWVGSLKIDEMLIVINPPLLQKKF